MIREIRPDDWQSLRDVRLRALEDAPYAFLTTHADAAAQPDDLGKERATPGETGTTFVVDVGGRFEGMVSAFLAADPRTAHLVAMWVAPGRRGSGEAAALVERVVAWARGAGAARVALTVEGGNDRAAGLYRRCGFAPGKVELPYEPHEGSTTMVRAT